MTDNIRMESSATIIGSLGLVDKKPEAKKEVETKDGAKTAAKPFEIDIDKLEATLKDSKTATPATEAKTEPAKSNAPAEPKTAETKPAVQEKTESKPKEKTADSAKIPPVSHINGVPQR